MISAWNNLLVFLLSFYATAPAAPTKASAQIPQVKNNIAEITTAIIPITKPAVAKPDFSPAALNFLPAITARTKPTIATGSATIEKIVPKKLNTKPTRDTTNPAIAKPFILKFPPLYFLRCLYFIVLFPICQVVYRIFSYNLLNTKKVGDYMNKDIAKIVGENLKLARKAKGITQKELAKELNKYQPDYSEYESGKIQLDYEKIIYLCERLDITPNDLFGINF